MMKYTFALILFLAVTAVTAAPTANSGRRPQTVNAILGDVSFVERFGFMPNGSTDEDLRLATHLTFVETLLRNRSTGHLSPELRARRAQMLDLLHEYRVAAAFPRNHDYRNQRRPCFIDRDGNICAVGYLVEKSAGRATAEAISAKYKYAYIDEMNAPEVRRWIAASGLTLEECGMIQPSYGWIDDPPTDTIPVSYGVGTALVGGLNVALNAVNGVQLLQGSSDKIVPAVGFAAGAGQVILGVTNISEDHLDENNVLIEASETKNLVSYLNIGMGTATALISVWNFFNDGDSTPDPTPINWNLHTVPAPDDELGIGLTVSGKF